MKRDIGLQIVALPDHVGQQHVAVNRPGDRDDLIPLLQCRFEMRDGTGLVPPPPASSSVCNAVAPPSFSARWSPKCA